MKGQTRTGLKLMAVWFASAALTFAQMNTVPSRAAQSQGPYSAATGQYQGAPNQGGEYGAIAPAQAGPGTINYVEGQASLNGQVLSQTAVGRVALEAGGVIATGDGYVEILLTPGTFLRVGHNSEIRMGHAGLADTRVEVSRGVSQIEVEQLMQGSSLSVELNGAVSQIEKKGLYSFDAAQQSVRVLDGKATVTEGSNHVTLSKNHELLLAGGEPWKKHSFDDGQAKREPLYVWSRIRSQDEAQVSYTAARNAHAYSAADTGWFWDPYVGGYGFWPADAFLYRPFGFGFYSPLAFGYYGGYWGHPIYQRGVYRGAFRTGGFAGAAHAGGFHGSSGFHTGGGFHGGGHR